MLTMKIKQSRHFRRILDEALDGLLSTPKDQAPPDLNLDADGVLASLSNDLDDTQSLEGGFPIRVMRRLPQSGLRMQLAAPVA